VDNIRKWGLERTKKELGSMKYEITIGLSNFFFLTILHLCMKYSIMRKYIHNLLACFSVVDGINISSVCDSIASNNINHC
jgi:hypothetical protein